MKHFFFALSLFLSTTAFAAPALKYTGTLSVAPNVIHKEGVKGTLELSFEGDTLAKVELKTEKPVVGKSQFTSTEQAVYSRTISGVTQMAVVFKLQGPPHKWYFVYVGATADQGANYAGKLFKVPGTMESIAATLTAGQTPTEWKAVGSINLVRRVAGEI